MERTGNCFLLNAAEFGWIESNEFATGFDRKLVKDVGPAKILLLTYSHQANWLEGFLIGMASAFGQHLSLKMQSTIAIELDGFTATDLSKIDKSLADSCRRFVAAIDFDERAAIVDANATDPLIV